MKSKETVVLSIQQQQQVDDFMRRFDEALKARPTISDEDFMAETEVSDEQYAMGLTLPGVGDNKGDKDD